VSNLACSVFHTLIGVKPTLVSYELCGRLGDEVDQAAW
jgi:hypothetical protein